MNSRQRKKWYSSEICSHYSREEGNDYDVPYEDFCKLKQSYGCNYEDCGACKHFTLSKNRMMTLRWSTKHANDLIYFENPEDLLNIEDFDYE